MTAFTHALTCFLADYHSGQHSRGYKLSCYMQRRARRVNCKPLDVPLSNKGLQHYDALIAKFATKV